MGYICQEVFEKIFRGLKMEFSERLKELRKKANLTQVEVAKKLGKGKKVLALAPDNGERYLSTALYEFDK